MNPGHEDCDHTVITAGHGTLMGVECLHEHIEPVRDDGDLTGWECKCCGREWGVLRSCVQKEEQ